MDAAFLLDDLTRAHFFRSLMQSLGCVYACLWSYFPQPSNCLISLDGYYNEADDQPSTSSGSLGRRLFDEYRQSIITPEDGHVPGLAFRNYRLYTELRGEEIQRLAHNDTQRLFYQEARIQTAVFMGCRSGEIELGLSYDTKQMNIEMGVREWFPGDFPRRSPVQSEFLHLPTEQNRPLSSSSSSLRSLDSKNISEYPPLIVSINPSTSQKLPESSTFSEANTNPTVQPPLIPITTSMIQGQTLAQIWEREDEAMTKAILAVLTSPSSTSSSCSSSQQQQQQNKKQHQLRPKESAFKRYYSGGVPGVMGNLRQQSMIKRLISYYRRLNTFQPERMIMGSRGGPMTTQLHHTIAERRRREKLNESFQALRLLLPQGTKKDKASVLAGAIEQLNSLQSEVFKLIQRNRELEAKLAGEREFERLPSDQRFSVRVTHASELKSEERIIDLRVIFRGENGRVDDMVIRLLHFIQQARNASLISMEARTRAEEEIDNSSSLVSLRIKIEGEWDESAFLEAVRRIVGDVAH